MKKNEAGKKANKGGILKFAVLVLIIVLVGVLIYKINNNNEQGNAINDITFRSNGPVDGTTIDTDGTIRSTSIKLKEEREVKGLKFKNADFLEKNGQSELVVEVKNETEKKVDGFLINVVLLNKEGAELGKIPASVIDVEAGEMIRVRAAITERYVGVYDYKIEER